MLSEEYYFRWYKIVRQRELKNFTPMEIKVCITASYTLDENGRVGLMNRLIKDAVRMMHLYSVAPVNLWAEYLYEVCDAGNRVVHAGRSGSMGELSSGIKLTAAHIRTFGCKV